MRSSPETPLTCERPYLSNPAYTFYWLGLSCPIGAVTLILLGGTVGFAVRASLSSAGTALFILWVYLCLYLRAGLTLSMFTLFYVYNLAISHCSGSTDNLSHKLLTQMHMMCILKRNIFC